MVSFMKNNKYKIIFLDIDDTLNVTNGDVTEYSKNSLGNVASSKTVSYMKNLRHPYLV